MCSQGHPGTSQMTALRNSASRILRRMLPQWSRKRVFGVQNGPRSPKLASNWVPKSILTAKSYNLSVQRSWSCPFSSLLLPSIISYHVKLFFCCSCFLSSPFSSLPALRFSLRLASLPHFFSYVVLFFVSSPFPMFLLIYYLFSPLLRFSLRFTFLPPVFSYFVLCFLFSPDPMSLLFYYFFSPLL